MLKIIATWMTEEGIKFEYLDGASKNRQEKVDRIAHAVEPIEELPRTVSNKIMRRRLREQYIAAH